MTSILVNGDDVRSGTRPMLPTAGYVRHWSQWVKSTSVSGQVAKPKAVRKMRRVLTAAISEHHVKRFLDG